MFAYFLTFLSPPRLPFFFLPFSSLSPLLPSLTLLPSLPYPPLSIPLSPLSSPLLSSLPRLAAQYSVMMATGTELK